MRKPFFLLLPSSLFQKGIPAVEANVHKMYLDYMDVTKRGKGWGREGKGREQEWEFIMEPELRLIEKHIAGGYS